MSPSPFDRSLPVHQPPTGHRPWCDCPVTGPSGRPVVTLTAPGMHDRSAVRRVAAHLHDVPGVVAVQIDLPSRAIRIEGDVDAATARRAVRRAGYEVT